LKWGYYVALLALSVLQPTNHPGFLVFDEPGQQEIEWDTIWDSMVALLQWSADNLSGGQQMLIATSEPLHRVQEAVAARAATILPFEGFILRALE
jgi:hypothetical protein